MHVSRILMMIILKKTEGRGQNLGLKVNKGVLQILQRANHAILCFISH